MNKKGLIGILVCIIFCIFFVGFSFVVYITLLSPSNVDSTGAITYNAGQQIFSEGMNANEIFYFHGITYTETHILLIGHQTSKYSDGSHPVMSNMEFSGIYNGCTFFLLDRQYQIVNFTDSQITLRWMTK